MLLQDIKYAVRSLVLDRGVTVIVILCLALGIGINATLFSVIDGVLIQSLPFAEADRLVVLNETFERGGVREAGVSYQDLQDWKRQTTAFSSMTATTGRSIALSDGGAEPERYAGCDDHLGLVPDARRAPGPRPAFQPGRRSCRRRAGGDPQRRRLGPPLQRRSRHHRPRRHAQRPASHRRRRDAAQVQLSRRTRRSGFRWRRSPRRIRGPAATCSRLAA